MFARTCFWQEFYENNDNQAGPTPDTTFRVVTYNVLCSAGVYSAVFEEARGCQENGSTGPAFHGNMGNRYDDLVLFLRAIDADIIGLQEVANWTFEDSVYARRIAADLDINIAHALGPGIEDPKILLTRWEVLDFEGFLESEGPSGMRARLRSPWGDELQVFNIHLEPVSEEIWLWEWEILLEELGEFRDEPSMLMGDFNTDGIVRMLPELQELGYRVLQVTGFDTGNDLIFVNDVVSIDENGNVFRSLEPAELDQPGLSDHYPVVADVGYIAE